MNFTIVWLPKAEQRLTEIWLAAVDKQAVADAADKIEQLLANRPNEVGEPRTAKIRYLNEPPLAVYYEIRSSDCLVQVRAIWQPPA